MKFRKYAGLTTALLMIAAMVPLLAAPALGSRVEPIPKEGNPTCASFGYDNEFKIEPVSAGMHTQGDLTVTLTLNSTSDGPTFNWSSNLPIDAVFVKGGDDGNLYAYDPATTSDSGLHAQLNPSGKWAGLSHLSFCWDDETTTTTEKKSTTTTEEESTTTTEEESTTTTEEESTTTTEEESTTTTEEESTTTTEEESTTTTEEETTTTTEAETTTTTEEEVEGETTSTTEAEEEVEGETTSTTEAEVGGETTSTTEDETEDTLPFTGIGTDGIALTALIALASGAGLIFLTGRSDESEIQG